MNDTIRERIAVLQHKRRQDEVYVVLSSISDKLGEAHHAPVDSSLSFRLQLGMYEKLNEMRAETVLDSAKYKIVDEAVVEFFTHASRLTSDAMCEFYTGAQGSGFFSGPFSQAFLLSCLNEGYEGFALVQHDLVYGVLLDVALDDPTQEDFYEVEWW